MQECLASPVLAMSYHKSLLAWSRGIFGCAFFVGSDSLPVRTWFTINSTSLVWGHDVKKHASQSSSGGGAMLRFPRLRAALKFCQLQSTMKKRAEDMISSLYFSRFQSSFFSNCWCSVRCPLCWQEMHFSQKLKISSFQPTAHFEAKVSLGDQEMLQNLFAHLGSQFGDGWFSEFLPREKGWQVVSDTPHQSRDFWVLSSSLQVDGYSSARRDWQRGCGWGLDEAQLWEATHDQHVFFQPDIARDFPLLGTWNMTLWSSGKSKRQWHSWSTRFGARNS